MTDTFLRELDRLQAATAGRLAIIGGTYRIDVVDQALIKDKSRFNRKVFLPPPDRAARRAVLGIYAARKPNDGRLDLDAVAALTEGYVGWDLENVVKKAALRAIEADRLEITQEDLRRRGPARQALADAGHDRGLPAHLRRRLPPPLQFLGSSATAPQVLRRRARRR